MKLLIFFFFSVFTLFANNLKTIESFEASFTQSIINSSGKEILYSGDIYLKKPLRILWRYNEPIEKWVYIVKDNATIIEPDLEQAIVSKLEKEFNIIELLENAKQISATQYFSTFNNTDYHLTIVENQLKKITYKDTIENQVTINFTNIRQNHPLDDHMFDFDIPSEYDIIKK